MYHSRIKCAVLKLEKNINVKITETSCFQTQNELIGSAFIRKT